MWNDSFQVYIYFNNVEMTANMYSELREEARDHARLRNAYFEQVCNFMPMTISCHIVIGLGSWSYFFFFLS